MNLKIVLLPLLVAFISCRSQHVGLENKNHKYADKDFIENFVDTLIVEAIVEIPAGTNHKYELNKKSGRIEIQLIKGNPRIVKYLPYPANYGFIPNTLLPKNKGGDGDPLDIIILGPSLKKQSKVECKILGILHMLDKDENDDKLIAVSKNSPLFALNNLEELKVEFNGILEIIKIWFANYKGKGFVKVTGEGSVSDARKILDLSKSEFVASKNNLSDFDGNPNLLEPFLLDRSVLSGIGLKKVKLKNEPNKEFHQKRLFKGQDISVYVVSSESCVNEMKDFPFDEFIYMLQGEAIVTPSVGESNHFYSGDYFFAPKGYTGKWEISSGNNLHYELSVISTKRKKIPTGTTIDIHELFANDILSGDDIVLDSLGNYENLLKKGVELTVKLKAEKPQNEKLVYQNSDVMIRILSGQIELISSDNSSEIFNTEDFLIIPKDWKGKWNSKGHGLIKYLEIQASK